MRAWRRYIYAARRRYVWQVVAAYGAVALLGQQLVRVLHAGLGLHDWVPVASAILFAIGIPMVAVTAAVNRRPPRPRDLIPTPPERLPQPQYPLDVPYQGDGASTAPLAPVRPRAPRLSWGRSLAMGVVAFALLGAGTSGYVGMRHYGIGPPGTLISRGWIEAGTVITPGDFAVHGADHAADSPLGSVVREALRLHLLESPVVRIAPEGVLVLEGDVIVRDNGVLLRARLTTADGTRVLAAFRESAADTSAVLAALDRLGRRMRTGIGESLRTVRIARPLAGIATPSLPAFTHYALSLNTPDAAVALNEARAAVAVDSTFALAWLRLAALLLEADQDPTIMRLALRTAHEQAARLRDRERLLVDAMHAHYVVGDAARAATLYESVLRIAPFDADALHHLPPVLAQQRRFAEAETLLIGAIDRGLGSAQHWQQLVAAQYALGRTDEALETLQRAHSALPADPQLQRLEATFAIAGGDWRRADGVTRSSLAGPGPASAAGVAGVAGVAGATGTAGLAHLAGGSGAAEAQRAAHLLDLSQIARAEGRLREAERYLADADALLARAGSAARRYRARIAAIEMTVITRVDRLGALRLLEELERELPLEDLPPAERPYLRLAEAYAWAGEPVRAQELLDAFEAAGLPPVGDESPAFTRGVIEIARGDVVSAIASLRAYTGAAACTICGLPVLGHALEAAEEYEAALEAWERYLATPYLLRRDSDAIWRAFVLGRAAELHERLGDRALAQQRYDEFARLWQRADSELQPQVAAARRRIRALNARGSR